MSLIIDVMTENSRDGNNDSFHVINRSYDSISKEYLSDEINHDIFVNDIYVYIGAIFIILFILFGVITMIRKCIKYYKKDEQTIHSDLLLTEVSIIRRNSSIRNSLAPNRQSSLDVRFQMESRERRLSKLHLIPLTT